MVQKCEKKFLMVSAAVKSSFLGGLVVQVLLNFLRMWRWSSFASSAQQERRIAKTTVLVVRTAAAHNESKSALNSALKHKINLKSEILKI